MLKDLWKRISVIVALALLFSPIAFGQTSVSAYRFRLLTGSCVTTSGAGSPEGAVVGSPCDTYVQTDPGGLMALWSKTSGSATNTGWQRTPGLGLANTWTAGNTFTRATGTTLRVEATGNGGSDVALYAYATASNPYLAIFEQENATSDIQSIWLRHTLLAGTTATAGIGVGTVSQLENASGGLETAGDLSFIATDAADATFTDYFRVRTRTNNANTEIIRFANPSTTLYTHFLFSADNTWDIGASGATRPRDLFLGRDAVLGRNALISGAAKEPSYASQTTGWQIDAAGSADLRYLFVDEMHTRRFIADLEMALAGSQIVSKSVAMVSQTFTCPSAGATSTLWVRDLPSMSNGAAFEANDWVSLRNSTRAAGSLTVADCVGQVSAYSDGAGANDGQQSWTFTRGAGGNAGTMAGAATVAVDNLALDYGVSGMGYYEVNAIDGAYGANSPYAQVVTWTTSPVAANRSLRARWGNLRGAYGYSAAANTYGFAAGNPADVFVSMDDTYGYRIFEGGTTLKGQWAPDGSFWTGEGAALSRFAVDGGATPGTVRIFDHSNRERMRFQNDGTALFGYDLGSTVYPSTVVVSDQVTNYFDANNYFRASSSGLQLVANGVQRFAVGATGDVVVGRTGAGQSNVVVASDAVKLRTATTDKIVLDTSGNITMTGNLNVGTAGAIRSGATAFDTTTGYWLDYNSGTPRFRIGNPAGQRMQWDGTNAYIQGAGFLLDSSHGIYMYDTGCDQDSSNIVWAHGSFIMSCDDYHRLTLRSPPNGSNVSNINIYNDYIGFWVNGVPTFTVTYEMDTTAFFPVSGRHSLGTSDYAWGDVWAQTIIPRTDATYNIGDTSHAYVDIFVKPSALNDASYPIVHDATYNVLRTKTDGANGTIGSCAGGIYSIDMEYGIVVGVGCVDPETGLMGRITTLERELAGLRAAIVPLLAFTSQR